MTAVLLAMIVLPALGAVLAAALGRNLARWGAVAVAGCVAALAVWSVTATFGTSYRAALGTLPWLAGTVDGPVFGLLLDPLASVLLLVATLIGFLTVLYSAAYMGERNRDHACCSSSPAWWASRWRPTSCNSSCSGS
jgi:NADH-quinone oxidoreductase subunit L